MRKKVTHLINQLAEENPKVPSNILHALQSIKPSQLMDQNMWNFRNLENELITNQTINTSELFSTTEFDSVEV